MLLYVTFLIYLVGMIGANERYCVSASPAYLHIYTCSYVDISARVDMQISTLHIIYAGLKSAPCRREQSCIRSDGWWRGSRSSLCKPMGHGLIMRLVISSVPSPEAAVPVDGDGGLLDADLLLQRQADALQLPLPPLALLQLNSEGWGGRLYYIAATEAVNRTAKCLNTKVLY